MKKILFSFMIVSILCSCAQPRVLDDINMSQTIGFDIEKNNNIEGIYIIPVFELQKQGEYLVLKAKADTVSDVHAKANLKSAKPIALGQTRVLLFSEKLAKTKSMKNLTDNLYRDPVISTRVLLAIGEGQVTDILDTKISQTNLNVGIFLNELIIQNMKIGNVPTTNFHLFLNAALEDESHAFLPIIKKTGNDIKVSGLALFHRNKIVDKVATKYMFTFKTLVEEHKRGHFQFNLKDNGTSQVAIEGIKGKATYDISKANDLPAITVNIKIKGRLKEYMDGGNLTREEFIAKIEKSMEKKLIKQANYLINDFQKKNIDPLQLKQKVLAFNKAMSDEDFKQVYPTMNITVKADVKIIQTGISQ
ncbi:Ger(x)C family spore germination protein [Peribacillus asahii]|uniref:Ger(x)C family spore germination protein n=1 Tax=Peribacillus asahii TaxID=228899 RepID=UPI00207AA3B2|nr:Ger(x)C family spore germination protein [Peribacillus asahii]USK69532.1 Ger(x)C family spore germination protein [Peribacillus asahii]